MIGEGSGQGLDLTSVTMLIASGLTLTFVALSLVFGGFFAERRLRDRLEDIETRARTGSRPLQMATLRRVDKAGRLPTLDKLLWRWFPNASKIRQKLLASGMNLTLGDFAFISIAIAVALAFLLHVVLDLAPVITLAGSLVVSLAEVAAAIRMLVERAAVVGEGAAGAAVAAGMKGLGGQGRVVCVVSGGNIDPAVLSTILGGGLPK